LGVVAESKAVAVDDAGFKEEFGVEGLVYDRMGWFGEEVCEKDWLCLAAGKRDGLPRGPCRLGGGTARVSVVEGWRVPLSEEEFLRMSCRVVESQFC
jgi:hypothetical protein